MNPRLEDSLQKFFVNYVNAEKLVYLLLIWLDQLQYMRLTRGDSGFEPHILKLQKIGSLLHVNEAISGNLYIPPIRPSYNFPASLVFLYMSIFSKFFLRGHSANLRFLSKLQARISQILLRRARTISSSEMRLRLIKLLARHLDNKLMSLVSCFLPEVFYSKPIKIGILSCTEDKVLHCSPTIFYDFDGYERLLLFQIRMKIFGYQHGGGYWLKRCLARGYEELLSDVYLMYGFSRVNRLQMRYKARRVPLPTESPPSIYWVERASMSSIYKYLQPDFWNESSDQRVIDYIDRELSKTSLKAQRLPYVLRQADCYSECRIKASSVNSPVESIFARNSLVLFDHVCHSLIFYCIEHNISFFCVVDLERYRDTYQEVWIEYLEKRGYLIDMNSDELQAKIISFSKDSNMLNRSAS
jgi:hypothetical protein